MIPTYQRIAYDGFEVANPIGLAAVEAVVARCDLPCDARALDLGAGTGGVSLALAGRFSLRVLAVERDPELAEGIRRRALAAGLDGRVVVATGQAQDVLDQGPPPSLIVALGATQPVGADVRDPSGILAGLAARLGRPGWLLWGDLFWKGDPPASLRQAVGLIGDYATDAGWRAAGEGAGLDWIATDHGTDADWDAYFEVADARVRTWLAANPEAPESPAIRARADQVQALFAFGRPWLGFGLYLFRRA